MLKRSGRGFTLIEIVLVLAIAGLIMVIVFLALSGAQKARRDTQRKSDANALAAAMEQYAANNLGAYPPQVAPSAPLATSYWNRIDPGGSTYVWNSNPALVPPVGTIAYNKGNICNGQVGTTTGATQRTYAVVIGLEQGGSYCVDNN